MERGGGKEVGASRGVMRGAVAATGFESGNQEGGNVCWGLRAGACVMQRLRKILSRRHGGAEGGFARSHARCGGCDWF